MGVAYFVGRRVLLSYVDAISQSKRYEQYCNMETNTSEETCVDDSVWVEECDAYKKLVKDPKHDDKDIPEFNKKQYKSNVIVFYLFYQLFFLLFGKYFFYS